jgi:hypothetical protein
MGNRSTSLRLPILVGFGGLCWLCYLGIAALSVSLSPEVTTVSGRATAVLWFFGLMSLAGLGWLFAFHVHRRGPSSWNALGVILLWGLVFRITLLPTPPILEIDHYRYFWDGIVGEMGISPYCFTPSEIIEADRDPDGVADHRLRRIVERMEQDSQADQLVRLVHYPEIPTVYPPACQRMFAAVSFFVGKQPLNQRIHFWKLTVLALELIALAGLARLLLRTNLPVGFLILPWWCPLAVKEYSNSGRIDVLAVAASVWSLVFLIENRPTFAGALLALAVGGKIYPLIGIPLFAVYTFRQQGRRGVLIGAVSFVITSVILWLPYWEPVPHLRGNFQGLSIFASQWEMNDFLFWCVSVVVGPNVARIIWAGFVIALAIILARSVYRETTAAQLLACQGVLLGWFWLTSPTGNPWYLLWFLPLLAFMKNPVWKWLPLVAMVYYLRFACEDLGEEWVRWFDCWGVTLEFGPWLSIWAWFQWRGKRD